ncbi:MAG TPA: polysaccharide biosynthesis/export family protein [Acidisarcina sp.]
MRVVLLGLIAALFVPVSRAQKESLLIGPGDLVAINVFQEPELDQHGRVTDAGDLPLILGGKVALAGLTPEEAARAVEQVLVRGQFLLNASVTVTIEQYATQNVSVLGQVKAPGTYPIGTSRSVLDVLALAGGLTDLADRRITIESHSDRKRFYYYLSNSADEALQTSLTVFPGDKIIVPRVDLVYVLGDVGRAGGFPESTNDSRLTVLEAVSLAGGTPPNAVPSRARLIRKHADGTYEEIHLPLSQMQKGKKPDMPLQANDIIYVPFSYARNIAVGLGGVVAATSSASIYRF